MQRKYQLMLDIHRGSMSLVCTPACSMLLNLMVMGNGSFTRRELARRHAGGSRFLQQLGNWTH